MEPTLDRFEAKLRSLKLWSEDDGLPCLNWTQGAVHSKALTEVDLQQIEEQYAISLPQEYRAFLLRFGTGRVGPGNYFYPVEEALGRVCKINA